MTIFQRILEVANALSTPGYAYDTAREIAELRAIAREIEQLTLEYQRNIQVISHLISFD